MEANVKISIIIPVYNADEYLAQCLDSAIAQTISPKEIICIDDGSADRSGEILKEYADKYDYIHCYKQENQGAGIARNYGLRMAQGRFVSFLDCDDYYLDTTALEKMYTACIESCLNVCGSFRSKNVKGIIFPMELHRNLFAEQKEKVEIEYSKYQVDYHYHNYIFSREMLEGAGIVFPDYRRYQDPPFFVRAMITSEKFCVVPVELYCYREDEASLNRKKTHIADALRGMIDNLSAAKDHNLKILHNMTVDRINKEYFEAIVEKAFDNDFEVLDLLRKADSMIDWKWYSGKTQDELLPLKMIKNIQYNKWFTSRLSEIQESHHVLTMWLKSCFGNSIVNYLKEKNINKIAIYGYGFFGELLYRELQNTEINVDYIIDKRKELVTDAKTVEPQSEWQPVDAIIISPLVYHGIINEWRDKFIYPTYILKDILMELTEDWKNFI